MKTFLQISLLMIIHHASAAEKAPQPSPSALREAAIKLRPLMQK